MSRDLSPRDAEPVSWIGGPRGRDEDAELVRDAIVARDLTAYGPLVAHLAERLFARDRACTGAAADIGFFRAWYSTCAQRVLERLEGTDIVVGAARSRPQARHA